MQRDFGGAHGSRDFTIFSDGYLTGFHSTLNDDLQRYPCGVLQQRLSFDVIPLGLDGLRQACSGGQSVLQPGNGPQQRSAGRVWQQPVRIAESERKARSRMAVSGWMNLHRGGSGREFGRSQARAAVRRRESEAVSSYRRKDRLGAVFRKVALACGHSARFPRQDGPVDRWLATVNVRPAWFP